MGQNEFTTVSVGFHYGCLSISTTKELFHQAQILAEWITLVYYNLDLIFIVLAFICISYDTILFSEVTAEI